MSSLTSQFDDSHFASRIASLRSGLRSWLTVRGLARLAWIVLAIAAADMILDRSFRMDVAQRGIMLVLMVSAVGFTCYRLLFRPVSRPITDDALVLEVEKRNPGLGQSVITGFQLLRENRSKSQSPELVAAAIGQGIRQSESIDFSSVLNHRAGRQNWLILATGILAIAALVVGIFSTAFLQTWFRRNLMLSADLWPRATQLMIVGAEDGEITVPRGIDHRQLVQVLETSRIRDVAVDLEIDTGLTRNIQRMKPTGKLDGREHAFVFNSIASDCRIRAIGGDDTTGWVALKLVEPPSVMEMKLDALLPKWTGRETEPLTGIGPHSVLAGSGLRAGITANKPLKSAELVRGELVTAMRSVESGSNRFQVEVGQAGDGDGSGVAGGTWAIRLVDELGLGNIRDTSFEIRIRENEKPSVRSRLLGISGLVVPTAHVPVEWGATDDYGIGTVVFEANWQDETVPIGERKIPVAGFAGSPVLAEIPEVVTILELEPLGLQPGMTLRFRQTATDYAEPSAATGISREFLLKIVTEEELLSDLLRREIEQRGVFQQAYDRQLELNSMLLQAVAAAGNDPNSIRETETRLLGLYRAQRTIGTSIIAVASRFEEFLVEVANNRLDEHTGVEDPGRTIQGRFENEIIVPIRKLDDKLVNDAARGLESARRSVGQATDLAAAIRQTSATQEQILEAMRVILSAMQSSENYQEAVNRLLEIRRIEQNMQRELERKGSNPEDIFNPRGGGK